MFFRLRLFVPAWIRLSLHVHVSTRRAGRSRRREARPDLWSVFVVCVCVCVLYLTGAISPDIWRQAMLFVLVGRRVRQTLDLAGHFKNLEREHVGKRFELLLY